MDFRVVTVCSLGDGSSIHTKKKKAVIHSNWTGFVKLLLSICHHKSHFDLAFLGAVLHAQYCFLILHRRPKSMGEGTSRTHRKNWRPLFSEREGRKQTLSDLYLRRGTIIIWIIMRANTQSIYREPITASKSFVTL